MKKITFLFLLIGAVAIVSAGSISSLYAQDAGPPIVKCEIDEIPVDRDKDGDIDFCIHCNFVKCTMDEIEVVDPWGCVRSCRPNLINK